MVTRHAGTVAKCGIASFEAFKKSDKNFVIYNQLGEFYSIICTVNIFGPHFPTLMDI